MRISTKLKKAANFNPTKTTFQMTTEDLSIAIKKEQITLPLYQRDISWVLKKSVELLNYQLNGKAPVSAISFNKIANLNNFVEQVSIIEREIIPNESLKHGHYSVVDGQQRLTTAYKAHINHPDFKRIVLDLIKGDFRIEDSVKKFQIPVGILLNEESQELYKYMRENDFLNDFKATEIIHSVRTKMNSYNYTINIANDLTEDEQIEWFEVLNNAGSRVTRIQMEFSKLKVKGIDIYTQYTKPFMQMLQDNGFDDILQIKTTEVSIPIANLNPAYEKIMKIPHKSNYAPIPSDTKEKQLCNLEPNKLKECFDLTLIGLDKALNFININSLNTPSRIDYISYLTGYFIYNHNELSSDENQQLIDWYNTINFQNASNGNRRKMFENLILKNLSK